MPTNLAEHLITCEVLKTLPETRQGTAKHAIKEEFFKTYKCLGRSQQPQNTLAERRTRLILKITNFDLVSVS